MSWKSTVSIYGRTGIGDGNYMAFQGIGISKVFVDKWFEAKKITDFGEISAVMAVDGDRNHLNGGSVHLPIPFNKLHEKGADYLMWRYEGDERTWYGIISGWQAVNQNSCRIMFQIDYVATFWDLIKLKKSHITRRSEKRSDKEYTNAVPENIQPRTSRHEMSLVSLPIIGGTSALTLEDITKTITASSSLCLCTPYELGDENEIKMDNIAMTYQMGGTQGGFIYCFQKGDIDIGNAPQGKAADEGGGEKRLTVNEFMRVAITASSTIAASGQPLLSALKYAYFCPDIVAAATTPANRANEIKFQFQMPDFLNPSEIAKQAELQAIMQLFVQGAQALPKDKPFVNTNLFTAKTLSLDDLNDIYKLSGDEKLKNKKVLNSITYSLIGQSGTATASPFDFKDWKKIRLTSQLIGGATGKMRIGFQLRALDPYTMNGAPAVETAQWASVGISGSAQEQSGRTISGSASSMWNFASHVNPTLYAISKIIGQ